MTCSRWVLVALVLIAAACGSTVNSGDGGTGSGAIDGGDGGAVCPPEPSAQCSPAKHVGSVSDFTDVVMTLTWQVQSAGKTGTLLVSDDLVADADLQIDSSVVVPPCETTSDAGSYAPCAPPLFKPRGHAGAVAGVQCPANDGGLGAYGCARVLIAAGATFRIRALRQDQHPSPTQATFVQFERACPVPCDDGQTRCAATQTCFPRGYEACAYCEANANEVCACRDGCGAKDEGASCNVVLSPDNGFMGTCVAGACVK